MTDVERQVAADAQHQPLLSSEAQSHDRDARWNRADHPDGVDASEHAPDGPQRGRERAEHPGRILQRAVVGQRRHLDVFGNRIRLTAGHGIDPAYKEEAVEVWAEREYEADERNVGRVPVVVMPEGYLEVDAKPPVLRCGIGHCCNSRTD